MQISFDGLYANNLQNISLQNLCNLLPYDIVFPKAKNYQNLTTKSGSKQRFSLLQEKEVIQAVCLRTQAVSIKAPVLGLNGGLWLFWKSQKISTASDHILFELCKKKL